MSDAADFADVRDHIHRWFNLTYAAYLTIPRSVLQSMPTEWQRQMVALLTEMEAACAANGIELPKTTVNVRNAKGRFMHEWLANYERGRRNVFMENVKIK